MNKAIRFKLFLMMVLEFFIWGAWLPLIFGYLPSLGFSASEPPAILASVIPKVVSLFFSEQSLILNAFPIAAIVGMFFSNQFADRNFAAERFLAVSHLIAGLAILSLAWVKTFWPFFGLMLVHCLLYVPTISITNSIAFAQMKDAQKEFGIVRMGGTIGWILAAWPFAFILVDWAKVKTANPNGIVEWIGAALANGLTGAALQDATKWTYIVAGIASLTLAAFSLTLPHTPPKKAGEGAGESLAWLEALKLLKHPFVLVLWLVTFVDSFVHNCYFNWTGSFLSAGVESGGVGVPGNWVMPVMSIGQVAEILTMFILGATLKAFGWRTTMIFGILGHAARFAVYAFFPQHKELIIVVQVLHGICYAFFFATVYIFVDEYFPKDARASAQGLFNVMILGVGALVANTVCPTLIQKTFANNGVTDFKGLFFVPLAAALAAAVAMALFFRPPMKTQPAIGGATAPAH
ncbi:MAG TPA: MFS transporter [Verrucomicrobiae bacterium]|jgi:MFS family permease